MKNLMLLGLAMIFALSACKNDDEQMEIDDQLIREYIEENMLDAESTESGLYYIIEEPGNDEHPELQSTIAIRYTGRLLDGEEFDSSNGNIVEFKLYQLIEGWQEGIPLFGKQGKGVLLIPSHLGYGNQWAGTIPPNSVLEFDIELVDFE